MSMKCGPQQRLAYVSITLNHTSKDDRLIKIACTAKFLAGRIFPKPALVSRRGVVGMCARGRKRSPPRHQQDLGTTGTTTIVPRRCRPASQDPLAPLMGPRERERGTVTASKVPSSSQKHGKLHTTTGPRGEHKQDQRCHETPNNTGYSVVPNIRLAAP